MPTMMTTVLLSAQLRRVRKGRKSESWKMLLVLWKINLSTSRLKFKTFTQRRTISSTKMSNLRNT